MQGRRKEPEASALDVERTEQAGNAKPQAAWIRTNETASCEGFPSVSCGGAWLAVSRLLTEPIVPPPSQAVLSTPAPVTMSCMNPTRRNVLLVQLPIPPL